MQPSTIPISPLQADRPWKKLLLGLLLLVLALLLGRNLGHQLPVLEQWVASHGLWGRTLFVVAVTLFTLLLIPDAVFAVMAGLLFGLFWGTTLVLIACLAACSISFTLSRRFLHDFVGRWLEHNARMTAIERAVNREGFYLQLLLRLTPISPVAMSYALGASNTRYLPFLTACIGVIPALFVEVYLGVAANHVAKVAGNIDHSAKLHLGVTLAGLLAFIALSIWISRLASKAIQQEEKGGLANGKQTF